MEERITSLAEFMNWVTITTTKLEESHVSFYRGHDNDEYKLMPSVYRIKDNKSYRKLEYRLYHDMLTRNPSAFSEDKTIFDRLVRMQHNGLPTRLLDITQNPLVALFFACQKLEDEKNGEVIFFSQKKSEMTYPSAIPQITLSWLEASENYLAEIFKDITDEYGYFLSILDYKTDPNNPDNTDICNLVSHVSQLIRDIKSSSGFSQKISLSCRIENKIESLSPTRNDPFQFGDNESELYKEACQAFSRIIEKQCKKLGINIDEQWSSIENYLIEFTKFYFVYPPLNNERIRRQQGAFIVFPSFQPQESNLNYQSKITIESSKKEAILNELHKVGLTRGYIFPELEEQARDTCFRYPPQ